MTEVFFIILYGLSLIGGVALACVWGRVAWRGACLVDGQRSFDQFCLIALGLALGSVGNVVIFGTRTWTTLRYGVEGAVLAQAGVGAILLGLLILAVSKVLLMWAHDTSHKSLAWRTYAVVSLVWIIAAPLWLMWRT